MTVPHSSVNLFEEIRTFLPQYLSPHEADALWSELRQFPDNMKYFTTEASLQEDLLQGDGWRGFVVYDHDSRRTRDNVPGLVLSNSCDINSQNRRPLPARVVYSPLVSLARYEERLRAAGISEPSIEDTLTNIRHQRATTLFYLPHPRHGLGETIALLDNVYSEPLETFTARKATTLFTLSQYGFYLLLLKLSIHFTRFGENVARG